VTSGAVPEDGAEPTRKITKRLGARRPLSHDGRHRAGIAERPPVAPPPAASGPAVQLRMPAVWMVAVLVAIGAWRIGLIFADAVRLYPRASAIAFVLFAAYAVPFIWVVREVDWLEREPFVLLATAFCWGRPRWPTSATPRRRRSSPRCSRRASPTGGRRPSSARPTRRR
jgi:hypothetical protein